MKRLLVAEQWDSFMREVLPRNASTVQRWEMRRAFYAGAEAVLFRIIAALAPESEPTESDLALLSEVHQELQDFAKSVKEGRA